MPNTDGLPDAPGSPIQDGPRDLGSFAKTTPGKILIVALVAVLIVLGRDYLLKNESAQPLTESSVLQPSEGTIQLMRPDDFYMLDQKVQDKYNYDTRFGKSFTYGVAELNRSLQIKGSSPIETPDKLASIDESDQMTLDRLAIYDFLASVNTYLDPFQPSSSPEAEKNLSFYINRFNRDGANSVFDSMRKQMGSGNGSLVNTSDALEGSGTYSVGEEKYKVVALSPTGVQSNQVYQIRFKFKEFSDGGVWAHDQQLTRADEDWLVYE